MKQKMSTPEMVCVATWGSCGKDEGEFNLPWGIAFDAEGNVYVADIENHRIHKFAPEEA